jgi:hypothetical protein
MKLSFRLILDPTVWLDGASQTVGSNIRVILEQAKCSSRMKEANIALVT